MSGLHRVPAQAPPPRRGVISVATGGAPHERGNPGGVRERSGRRSGGDRRADEGVAGRDPRGGRGGPRRTGVRRSGAGGFQGARCRGHRGARRRRRSGSTGGHEGD
ncbi:hypothetical protein DDE18_21000 [Nocardioides gansuensis]|uniref:Uncharacterized protein n=1 Tax=Nocardioides gansuensis TaxID=2138300 RepID=A0A2T8F581_9ACTN|nr:hypothetical protein DDE18_21000 [Nocardioides gansuensis]